MQLRDEWCLCRMRFLGQKHLAWVSPCLVPCSLPQYPHAQPLLMSLYQTVSVQALLSRNLQHPLYFLLLLFLTPQSLLYV